MVEVGQKIPLAMVGPRAWRVAEAGDRQVFPATVVHVSDVKPARARSGRITAQVPAQRFAAIRLDRSSPEALAFLDAQDERIEAITDEQEYLQTRRELLDVQITEPLDRLEKRLAAKPETAATPAAPKPAAAKAE